MTTTEFQKLQALANKGQYTSWRKHPLATRHISTGHNYDMPDGLAMLCMTHVHDPELDVVYDIHTQAYMPTDAIDKAANFAAFARPIHHAWLTLTQELGIA